MLQMNVLTRHDFSIAFILQQFVGSFCLHDQLKTPHFPLFSIKYKFIIQVRVLIETLKNKYPFE